jgi:hypothetical protein
MGVISRAMQYGDTHPAIIVHWTKAQLRQVVLRKEYGQQPGLNSPLGCHISDVNLQVGGEFG